MFRLFSLCLIAVLFAQEPGSRSQVINGGVPGQTSAEIDGRVDTDLSSYSPDVVVLFAGMNDAVNDKKFASPQISRSHLASIIRKSRQHGARVLLVTVHQPDTARLMQRHSREAYGDRPPQQRIQDLDAEIQSLAAAEQVSLVDFAGALKSRGGATPDWSTDGVHLTAPGYALLARLVYEGLQRMGSQGRRVLCLGDSLTFGIGVRQPDAPDSEQSYPGNLRRLLQLGSTP